MATYTVTVEDAQGNQFDVDIESEAPPTNGQLDILASKLQESNTLGDVGMQGVSALNRGMLGTADMVTSLARFPINQAAEAAGSDYRMRSPSEYMADMAPGVGQDYMQPGLGRDAVDFAGEVAAPAMVGSIPVKRDLARLPEAVLEILGFGAAAGNVARTAGPATVEQTMTTPQALEVPGPSKAEREVRVLGGKGKTEDLGYKVDNKGVVVRAPEQKRAVQSGLSERFVAQVGTSSKADKGRVEEMLQVLERGLSDKTWGDMNTPRIVLGDAALERYKHLKSVNAQAGVAVDATSQGLRGKPIDLNALYNGPILSFTDALKKFDVVVNGTNLDFSQSVFKKSPASQKAITDAMEALSEVQNPNDAWEVHKAKLVLDEMVDEYGVPSQGGLGGKTDRLLKNLRHDLNQFLRPNFPEYAAANDAYSETIEVLNQANSLMGRNNPVDEESLGRELRKMFSNYRSGQEMRDMVGNLESVATKYGGDFDDDLYRLGSIVQSVEEAFPTARPPASLQGQVGNVMNTAMDMSRAAQGDAGALGSLVQRAGEKFFTYGEVQAAQDKIRVLRELLAE